jgi:CheY-like chemotaxis protein
VVAVRYVGLNPAFERLSDIPVEVARHIKERFENLKLVALTGYRQDEDVRRTRAAGFDEHLVKPVAVEKLEQATRKF